jgi:hypothetical protein
LYELQIFLPERVYFAKLLGGNKRNSVPVSPTRTHHELTVVQLVQYKQQETESPT